MTGQCGPQFLMTVAVIYSCALFGMHAPLVRVEVHLANGLPAFNLVGLPETAKSEPQTHRFGEDDESNALRIISSRTSNRDRFVWSGTACSPRRGTPWPVEPV